MMKMVFHRKFEAAHRLIEGENGNTICSQPHGHTWNIRVFLEPTSPEKLNQKENTLVLFAKAKKQWHQFVDDHLDHSFLFNQNDPLFGFMLEQLPNGRHVVVPGDPTTEMVTVLCKAKLEAILKDTGLPLKCTKVEINETQTNGIHFSGNPQEHLPTGGSDHWWNRPDMSTRD